MIPIGKMIEVSNCYILFTAGCHKGIGKLYKHKCIQSRQIPMDEADLRFYINSPKCIECPYLCVRKIGPDIAHHV